MLKSICKRGTGVLIEDEEVLTIGYNRANNFINSIYDDILNMTTYPEEPNDLNGEYQTEHFEVLHTIVGDVEGEVPIGFGRLTYNFVDVGLTGKVLVVIFNLEIADADEYGINDYELIEATYFFIPEGEYLTYLMQVEQERDII